MSIQTMQNNKKLYKFTYKEDEKKQLIKMMQYDGDLLFNGILPLDLEVKILKMNGYIYNYDTQEIMQPLQFRLINIRKYLYRPNYIAQTRTIKNNPNKFVEDLKYNGKCGILHYCNQQNKTTKQIQIQEKKSYLVQIIKKYNMHYFLMATNELNDDEAEYIDISLTHYRIDKKYTIKRLLEIIDNYNNNVYSIYPFNFNVLNKVKKMNNEQLKEFFYADN